MEMTELFRIELAKPVFLYKQIPALSKAIGIDESKIEQILRLGLLVEVNEDNTYQFIKNGKQKEGTTLYYGEKAIHYLLDQSKEAFSDFPLLEVVIPKDVFFACTPREWHDITALFVYVSNRSYRLKRLLELHAPEIIIMNEERLLWEAVARLEDNDNPYCKPEVNENNIQRRSLSEVEYSLLTGWSEEKERQMEEERKAFIDTIEGE